MRRENGTLVVPVERRIDAKNVDYFEKNLFERLNRFDGDRVVFDMVNLEYISSAGLRVLLKCRKRMETPIVLEHVSDEVYDILSITGFYDLFEVRRKVREISNKKGEVLAESINGKIYSLDDENVVKVFRSNVSLDDIEEERKLAHKALVCGVPTAIPYDVVRIRPAYGIVYEAINMKSIANAITENPHSLEHYAERFAAFLRELHSVEVRDVGFPSIKDRYESWIAMASGRLDHKVSYKIQKLIMEIPDRSTYIHGEINLSNVMIHKGELLLLDTVGSSYGHPIFDLQSLYAALVKIEKERPMYCSSHFGISGDLCRKFWDVFLQIYMSNQSDVERKKMNILLDQYYVLKQELVSKLQGMEV
ncbi:MAG: anti-sigma factor antagonist [Lachnospiraceae bacterium]|nr:anti-sigma factor antagonist [Lachnospiraceae bacterium]